MYLLHFNRLQVYMFFPSQRCKLVGIHMSFTLAAVLVIAAFLDDLPLSRGQTSTDGGEESGSAWHEAKQSVLVTLIQCRKPKQLLMMPLNIYIGMMQSYSLADLTEVCIYVCIYYYDKHTHWVVHSSMIVYLYKGHVIYPE